MAYGMAIEDAVQCIGVRSEPVLETVRLLLRQALALVDEINDHVSSVAACSISLAIDQLEDSADDGRC